MLHLTQLRPEIRRRNYRNRVATNIFDFVRNAFEWLESERSEEYTFVSRVTNGEFHFWGFILSEKRLLGQGMLPNKCILSVIR